MNTYNLKISSADGDILNEQVVALFLRGADGDLAVLAGHIPFVTTVKPCECRVEFLDGSVKTAKTDGGILSVTGDNVTLLSSNFEFS